MIVVCVREFTSLAALGPEQIPQIGYGQCHPLCRAVLQSCSQSAELATAGKYRMIDYLPPPPTSEMSAPALTGPLSLVTL